MIRNITWFVVLAGVVLIATSAQAAIIDDFTEGSMIVSDPGTTSVSQDSLDPAHVMGGKRTMSITSDVTGNAMSRAYMDPGFVALATDPTFQADLTLLWDGGPMNIIPNDEDAIEVTVDNADHAGDMTITLTDTDGSIVAVTKSFSAGSNFTLLFTEADFADPANEIDYGTDGFDPTMTQSIELLLDGSPAGDYQLSLVQTVPEPATMAILTLGGLGAMTIRRRR
ncbi:MAG: PEP-CTERM sorting domain-containing protein [Phycisphaerae bacterium]